MTPGLLRVRTIWKLALNNINFFIIWIGPRIFVRENNLRVIFFTILLQNLFLFLFFNLFRFLFFFFFNLFLFLFFFLIFNLFLLIINLNVFFIIRVQVNYGVKVGNKEKKKLPVWHHVREMDEDDDGVHLSKDICTLYIYMTEKVKIIQKEIYVLSYYTQQCEIRFKKVAILLRSLKYSAFSWMHSCILMKGFTQSLPWTVKTSKWDNQREHSISQYHINYWVIFTRVNYHFQCSDTLPHIHSYEVSIIFLIHSRWTFALPSLIISTRKSVIRLYHW